MIKRLPAGKTVWAILFLLLQTGCALYLPYLTAGIVNHGIVNGDTTYIWHQGSIMMLFALLSLAGALLNMYLAGNIAFVFAGELRGELYRKVLSFSRREYDSFGASSLITRSTNDVTQVQTLVEMGLKFLILSPLYLIGGIALTWRLNSRLALIFMAIIPFMSLAALVIHRFAGPLYEQMQKLLDLLNLKFREGLTGVRVIRAFTREESDFRSYDGINTDYTRTAIAAGTIMSVFVPLITLLLNLSAVLIVWIGGNGVSAGEMEIGSIMAAISYSAQILMGFGLLTNVILALPRGRVSLNRINEVLDTPLSLETASETTVPQAVSLEFEQVSFRYPGAAERALKDITFSVKQGQTLAVIGSTGYGKTSLLCLIPRLYDAEQGAVRLGGVDVRNMEEAELRSLVSLAPQKSTLFAGTIRENMLIAKPDATDEQIHEALDAAQASGFVYSLPDGLDSQVEKGGANFSGGQKQRLCIARTLLRDAAIYLFDDSFSALDFRTDSLVRAAIRKRLSNAITVIVAQRVSAVMDADCILVLEKGQLAGLGTHEELLEHNPVYQEIFNSQRYKEDVA